MKTITPKKGKLHNLIPEKTDRCAVSPLACIKRSALLFDKVYVPNDMSVDDDLWPPLEIAFGFTQGDVVASIEIADIAKRILWGDKSPSESPITIEDIISLAFSDRHSIDNPLETAQRISMMQYRGIANAYAKFGFDVTPVYPKENSFFDEFLDGSDVAYQVLMRDVILIRIDAIPKGRFLSFVQEAAGVEA